MDEAGSDADLVVIGAGRAAVAAATGAARRGRRVVLLAAALRVRWRRVLARAGVRVRPGRRVWSVVPGYRVDVLGPDGLEHYAAPALVVETGVRERVVPFPGWTLPGVSGLAGGMPGGRRVVLAGCGPLFEAACAGSRVGVAAIATLPGHAVLRAEGDGVLRRVLVAPVDARGVPRGAGRWIEADALGVSHGLVPSSDVLRLLRVPHRFSAAQGGWVPVLEGDGFPGLRVVRRDGPVPVAPPPGLLEAVPDETVVCRCEGVTRGGIERAAALGAREMNQLKHFTRCGMGPCQGRLCAEAAAGLLGGCSGRMAAGQWTLRPPLVPVPLDALIGRFSYDDIPVPVPAPL